MTQPILAAVLITSDGRLHPVHIKDAPDFSRENIIMAWCMQANPNVSSERFVNAFADINILFSQVYALLTTINRLTEADRAFAVELISAGAFSRNEFLNPAVILAYFARPDWTKIAEAWRQNRIQRIRHIVRRADRPPPKPHNTTRGNGPGPAPMREKEIDPMRSAIEGALSGKRKKQAANCEVALQVLADHPTLSWTAERIAVQVMARRKSCGTTFTTPDALACLKQLKQSGLVTQDGTNFRHKPRA